MLDAGITFQVLIGVITLIATVFTTYFAFVVRITNRVTKLESGYDVFWKVLEPHLASIIHSPVHKRRDLLMDKMVSKTLSDSEKVELVRLLKACYNDCSPDRKLAVSLILARLSSIVKSEKMKWLLRILST